MDENNRAVTPAQLEVSIYTMKSVAQVNIVEVFDENTSLVWVTIRLTFWASIRCLLSARYRVKKMLFFAQSIKEITPIGVDAKITLEL